MANIKRGKTCKRYDCLYHPAITADNGCDYYYLTGKDRIKDSKGRCKTYVKATPEERRKFNESKYSKILYAEYLMDYFNY